jgi:predicted nucleic acid-binding Zn ribbon protein
MPIYVYETVPASAPEHAHVHADRFEVRQSMHDAPLSQHPSTGAPVRRVLSGGLATFTHGASGDRCAMPAGQAPSMGCGAGNCCMS